MLNILATVLAMSLPGDLLYAKPPSMEVSPIVITHDTGGYVIDYYASLQETNKVEIKGLCASACTLYLSVKDICQTKDASFVFHSVKGGETKEQDDKATRWLFNQYPAWVQKWITKHGGLTDKLITMPYSVIAKNIKPCE